MAGDRGGDDPQAHVLSIGALSEATGMSVPALRAWERRYGFPAPHRTRDGGHRRYSARDVPAIGEVRRRQAAGERLGEAIASVLDERGGSVTLSVFPEVTAAFPDLPRTTAAKPTLLALSRVIEDEVLEAGAAGHLFGCFQTLEHYERSRERWRRLAGHAATAHAFARAYDGTGAADHADHAGPAGDDGPVVLDLPDGAPLNREWLVVFTAPHLSAALLALELPGQEDRPDRERVFETAWTTDAEVVGYAVQRCAAAASAAGSGRATEVLAATSGRGRRTGPRFATERLVQRLLPLLGRGAR